MSKKELSKLSKDELLDLIVSYDNYVKEMDMEAGQYPVCLSEYYENDYLLKE